MTERLKSHSSLETSMRLVVAKLKKIHHTFQYSDHINEFELFYHVNTIINSLLITENDKEMKI